MYLLYRSRHVVSWLPALVVAGCLLFVSQQAVLQVKPHYDDTVMELSLAEPEPPQPEPVPEPQPEIPPQIQPEPEPEAVAEPVVPAPEPIIQANVQAVENGYLQALRRELEQRKRYPSGRQASLERPQGNVEVWLEVDRSGRVLASGIASRAPNMLLNRAALSSLQSISQLKPFPEEAFAGQSSKKFTATFNYQAP